ncbi:heavy metal-binding protein HIP-like isoform X1 [Mercenaria mercenaria]|uniref:heavy metal-binding protein HIP-like isoform X1 n=1 Tax=Mercenaria mercenaria TaxID=6596 RepID=UPI00234FAB51|nr:heavy metal-binding protein HIP-like isoform X1 [Mercenaria mercenaria]
MYECVSSTNRMMVSWIIFISLLFAVENIKCNTESIEPGQCLSKFDHDYKVMQKLLQLETQIASQADEIKDLTNINKVFAAQIASQAREINQLMDTNKTSHHVAFMAELSTSMVNPEKGTTVVFDNVHVNEGSSYKPGTGTFVAPASGIYSVTVVATAERRSSSGQQLHLYLMHNSNKIGYIFLDGNTNWPLLRTISVVVKLSYGDTLFVKIGGITGVGTLVGCCFHTHFSGFLVQTD